MSSIPQSPIRLLIVENDETFSKQLLEYFRSAHYTTTTTGDAETALRYLSRPPGYDVALLNATLPGKSGFDLLFEARKRPIDTSFLIVSEKTNLDGRLRGFTLGAEDFIVKPFEMEELEARVKAVLRRRLTPTSNGSDTYRIDGLTINFASNTCHYEDQRIPLTALEFEILEYFVENRGRVVSREELRTVIWDESDSISLRTIDRHVAKIREKLEPNPKVPSYLQTVYGKGYEFACAQSGDAAPKSPSDEASDRFLKSSDFATSA